MTRSSLFAAPSGKLTTCGGICFLFCIFYFLDFFNEFHKVEQKNISNDITRSLLDVKTKKDGKLRSKIISQNKTRAVIHVGPRKTGTSSIQATKIKYIQQLKKDGYEIPRSMRKPMFEPNESKLADCLRIKKDCKERGHEAVTNGLNIARRRKNIFLTSESFSYFSNYESLSKYLLNWDHTTIVIYYRRYYDWLCSHYHELLRERTLKDTKLWEITLLEYLEKELSNRVFTNEVISRLKKVFDDIVVMDFHDRSQSLVKGFYCDAMPDAHHTCQAVANASKVSVTGEVTKQRVSISPVWGDLAYAAHSRGLIDITSDAQMDFAKSEIQKHQEVKLGLTRDDFKLTCLSDETLQHLLKRSLDYELALYPNRNGTDLISDFAKASTSLMCQVDLNATLTNPEWIVFFRFLDEKLPSIGMVDIIE